MNCTSAQTGSQLQSGHQAGLNHNSEWSQTPPGMGTDNSTGFCTSYGGCSTCGACTASGQASPCKGYSAQEWAEYNETPEGSANYRYWADWIPTADGQNWVANKLCEARCVVHGMINQWGLETLRSGEGVIDVGGDPGFLASELLSCGIHVTVVDPAFGFSGKTDRWTMEYLYDPSHQHRVRAGAVPFRVLREPFNETLVADPANAKLMNGFSALVSFYPDEATDFLMSFSAANASRTAVIPCNECKQYFPPHDPTYEGFVRQLLSKDRDNLRYYGQVAPLQRRTLSGTPFCPVLLERSPAVGHSKGKSKGNLGKNKMHSGKQRAQTRSWESAFAHNY
eukprot:TRINITY_DN107639_c0_g1_i1.p1 TRINITY_DN107639_c0_g1~~TRINITY_DN107639_c0_g1_i1.p1  ORF type:complete len:338 (-),score=11.77 TRINITY_DN107639_c0_g1_i1:12-1025(-)